MTIVPETNGRVELELVYSTPRRSPAIMFDLSHPVEDLNQQGGPDGVAERPEQHGANYLLFPHGITKISNNLQPIA